MCSSMWMYVYQCVNPKCSKNFIWYESKGGLEPITECVQCLQLNVNNKRKPQYNWPVTETSSIRKTSKIYFYFPYKKHPHKLENGSSVFSCITFHINNNNNENIFHLNSFFFRLITMKEQQTWWCYRNENKKEQKEEKKRNRQCETV